MGEILQTKVNIQIVTINDLSNTPDNTFNGSTIDVIDDIPENKVSLSDIMSGSLTAFPVR